jgi:hypothetical protein
VKLLFHDVSLLLPVRSPRNPDNVVHCVAIHARTDDGVAFIADANEFPDEVGILNPRINLSLSQNDESPLEHAEAFVKRFGVASSPWWWSNFRAGEEGVWLNLSEFFGQASWAPKPSSEKNMLAVYHMAGIIQVAGDPQHISRLAEPECF